MMAGWTAHAQNGRISTSSLKSDVMIAFFDPNFLYNVIITGINLGDSHTLKAYIGLLNICMDFQDLLA